MVAANIKIRSAHNKAILQKTKCWAFIGHDFFPDFSFRSPTRYRFRQVNPETSFLVGSNHFADTDWHEFDSNKFRRVVLRPSSSTGLENYRVYFTTSALFRSIGNSLTIASISTIITVSLAFRFAYAINRSTMRFKGVFKLIAMIPILVPSLLPGIALGYCSLVGIFIVGMLTAVVGTIVVFCGAYVVEKTNGFFATRSAFQFLAMMPMAVPGMVLGLAYIFFFNDPANPLNGIYATLAILVICTVTHFYTVSHLTAVTALKQMDREFEAVASSLKQPFYRLFSRVTVPVCLPSILDISIYLFVNAMTTVSAVIFLYSPDTALASVAVLNMDDAGDIASAAAMGMMIFYTNVFARLIHLFITRKVMRRTQAWRTRQSGSG